MRVREHVLVTATMVAVIAGAGPAAAQTAKTIPVTSEKGEEKVLKVAEVSITYGGFIKLDALFSHFSDGDVAALDAGRDYFRPNSIPVAGAAGGNAHSFLDLHAKDSRFFFRMKSHVEGAELGGYLELDFRSSPGGNEVNTNSYNPRMRRAYFTWNQWLLGQEWSLLRNTDANPDHIDDLRGPTEALVIVRQPQVRYTRGGLQVALENAETNLLPFVGTASDGTPVRAQFVTGDSRVPDLTVRYNLKIGDGSYSVAALARELVADNAATGGDAPNALAHGTAFGYGLNVSGKVPVFGADDIRFAATAGDGVGRYLALATVADAMVDAEAGLEPIPVYAAYVSYRHLWDERWRSSFTVAGLAADHEASLAAGSATRAVNSAHANLLFSPIDKLTFGVELMHAERETEAGQQGALSRVQFSGKYDW